jgi:S1-C subfamily serine protease
VTGLLVTELAEGGPAESAGIILGDVLLAINGEPIEDEETLASALLRLQPGTSASLDLLRGGEPRQIAVAPGSQP